MNEIQKMYCPSCGAPIVFEEGREDTFCSHCGSQLYFHDDHLEVKLKYQDRHEERIYKDKDEERRVKEGRFYVLLIWGFVAFMILIIFIGLLIFAK